MCRNYMIFHIHLFRMYVYAQYGCGWWCTFHSVCPPSSKHEMPGHDVLGNVQGNERTSIIFHAKRCKCRLLLLMGDGVGTLRVGGGSGSVGS